MARLKGVGGQGAVMTSDPVDEVEATAETELDRIGSEKALIAATDANLGGDAVLGAVVDDLATARRVLDEWADAADDPDVADALATAASRFEDATDDVAAHLDREPVADAAIGDYLADAGRGNLDRAGAGLLGLPLVLDRTLLQVVSFFVNEAATSEADLARDLRTTCDEVLDLGGDLLADREDVERERAVSAAVDVIEAAYDDYVATLDGMGLDPKAIC